LPTHRKPAAAEKGFFKFKLGEANDIKSKVIGIIKNHKPPKPTLTIENKALKELRGN